MKTRILFPVIRWTARITGTLLILFALVFFFGETLEGYHRTGKMPLSEFSFLQIVTFIFWFLGMAGMIWAWWNEKAGGLFSFCCTVIFFILVKVNPEAHFVGFLYIFLLPSVLFIIYWWLTKNFLP